MRVKMILPALTEAVSPYFRPVKYSLFPPLGLAALAGYLSQGDEIEIQDEHVEKLNLDDRPNVVVLEVYITSSRRAYAIADLYRARGVYVCMGGLHPTSLPAEAAMHADSVFLGPGEDTWPVFLGDFRVGKPKSIYRSTARSLNNTPPARRDLIKRRKYLAPNTVVVSRGCPHKCDFCYKESFFQGGRSFCTMRVDNALSEIELLGGRHLFFLDDHLFGNRHFAEGLFDGMRGMHKLWQAAGTVESVFRPGLLEKAAGSGLRSLFIGFETINKANLQGVGKLHNLNLDYETAIKRLHDNGVMINASFVFGLDGDDESVFDRTVDWAIEQGIETATFHILTPYPGTALFDRMAGQGRILTDDWNLYDTRHAVFEPKGMTSRQLEAGYHRAYKIFSRWSNVFKSALSKQTILDRTRHLAYTGGWKKFEPAWGLIIRSGLISWMIPSLEAILAGFGRYANRTGASKISQDNTPAVIQGPPEKNCA